MNELIKEIEKYAEEKNVPIMQKKGINFLCKIIEKKQVKNILEIGTAIGYSSIKMALVNEEINVTTIEKDEERYNIAVKNIQKYNLEDRITIINNDALTTKIDTKFDLIFIDASKGHNTDFFNIYKSNLTKNGVIITDNLAFHGLVDDETKIKTKNQRSLVKKIKNFIDFLNTNEEFITTYIEVGDRISISKKVNE